MLGIFYYIVYRVVMTSYVMFYCITFLYLKIPLETQYSPRPNHAFVPEKVALWTAQQLTDQRKLTIRQWLI